MKEDKISSTEGFAPIYKEIAEIIGIENTYALYKSMRGVQVTFPKRLYTTEFILKKIKTLEHQEIRKFALKYDYTEKYLKQLLKEKNLNK